MDSLSYLEYIESRCPLLTPDVFSRVVGSCLGSGKDSAAVHDACVVLLGAENVSDRRFKVYRDVVSFVGSLGNDASLTDVAFAVEYLLRSLPTETMPQDNDGNDDDEDGDSAKRPFFSGVGGGGPAKPEELTHLNLKVIYFHEYGKDLVEGLQKGMCKFAHPQEKPENGDLFMQWIRKIGRKPKKGYQAAEGTLKVDLLRAQSRKDSFGLYEVDVLCGLLRLELTCPNSAAFPKSWIMAEDADVKIDMKHSDPELARDDGEQTSLAAWLKLLQEKHGFNASSVDKWMEYFKAQEARTVDDLKTWSDESWDSTDDSLDPALPTTIRRLVKQELLNFHARAEMKETPHPATAKDAEARTRLELIWQGKVFQVARFIYHTLDRLSEIPQLDPTLLKAAFNHMVYEGDVVKNQVLNDLKPFCVPGAFSGKRKDQGETTVKARLDPPRGVLLFGPPGTGKTMLIEELSMYGGVHLVCVPQTSGELNRPYVGETEQILKDILERAHQFPHLLCAVIIDEVESLVPKRKEGVAEHKVSGISVFLGLIGGARNVPNILLLLCTNKRNAIDDAILRRAKAQTFVGRPNPESRLKWISRQLGRKVADILVAPTVNFTGAALNSLIGDIHVWENDNDAVCESRTKLLAKASNTCKQFQIKLGKYSVPDLEVNLKKKDRQLLDGAAEKIKESLENMENDPRGLVLFALKGSDFPEKDDKSEFGYGMHCAGGEDTFSVPLKKSCCARLENTVLLLTRVARDRGIDSMFFFDYQSLLDGGNYDENKMLEALEERVAEVRLYTKAMVVVDLDTVVGVSRSLSDTGMMGPSYSQSPTNQRMFTYVLNLAQSASVSSKLESEFWVVLLSRSKYLLEEMRVGCGMLETDSQSRERENREKKEADKKCVNCGQEFTPKDNHHNSCNYHYGLLESKKTPGKKTSEEVRALPQAEHQNWQHVCCHAQLGGPPCITKKHDASGPPEKEMSLAKKKKNQ